MTKNSSRTATVPRTAIVGAGLMGRWHAHAVRRIGGKVQVIVDPDTKRAIGLARSCPGAKALPNLADAVGLADVVHICTPPSTHESLAQQALEYRMHALVEKPLTESSATTETLFALADSRGLLLCPVHQYLFQPGVHQLLKALSDLGRLLHFDHVICSAGAEKSVQSPQSIAADILPGPLSLVARLFGAQAPHMIWKVQEPQPGELRINTSTEESSISILISMQGRPTTNSLHLIGERGTAHVDLFHGFLVVEKGKVSRIRKIAHPFTLAGALLASATRNMIFRAARAEPAYPGLRELIRQFYKAIHTGSGAPISSAETIRVALARDQILADMRHANLTNPHSYPSATAMG